MTNRRDCRITLVVSRENKEFIDLYGGARKSDGQRYNVSAEVDAYLDSIRLGHSPEATAVAFMNERERLRTDIESVEDRAKSVLGTTLDDWVKLNQRKIDDWREGLRKDHEKDLEKKEDLREEIRQKYDKVRRGNGFKEKQDMEWLKGQYALELKVLGTTPLEMARELRGGE